MILETLSANGSTATLSVQVTALFLQLSGTFGGGTAVVEYKPLGSSTWYAVEGASFTSGPVSRVLSLPISAVARVTLSGATSPSLVVHLQRN